MGQVLKSLVLRQHFLFREQELHVFLLVIFSHHLSVTSSSEAALITTRANLPPDVPYWVVGSMRIRLERGGALDEMSEGHSSAKRERDEHANGALQVLTPAGSLS